MELSTLFLLLTGPLIDINNVNINTELSRALMLVSTLLLLSFRHLTPRPFSLGPDFIKYYFKHGGFLYVN
jgi:hypothetical protein